MNSRVIAIVMLYVAGIVLGIVGIVFLFEVGSAHSAYYHDSNEFVAQQRAEIQKARASLWMANGYVCLSIGSALFLTASILAFVAGTRRTPHRVEGKG